MDAWIHGLLKAVGSSIVALPWVPVETRPCLVDHAGRGPSHIRRVSKKVFFSRATPTLALERGPVLGLGWGGASPRKNVFF